MNGHEVTISQEVTGAEAPIVDTGRPENVPEQFWDAETRSVNTEALLAAIAVQNGEAPEAAVEKPEGEGDEVPKDGEAKETEAKETEDKATEIAAEAGVDVAAVEAHFLEKGEIPADTYEKMAKVGIDKAMVDEFVQYRVNQADILRDEMLRPYGGVEAVTSMTEWAGKNWNAEQAESFNTAMNSGNRGQIEMAVKALKSDFDRTNGVRPSLLTANTGKADSTGTFGSLAQLAEAQRDPRYKTDPAYRDSVIQKLARSNI
jgi:hypothetical protein